MHYNGVCVCVCTQVYIYTYKFTHRKQYVCYLSIYVYIYTEYYSAIKKNKNLPFAATWMDLEGIMLSEINQAEKDKSCMISLICGI